MSAYHELRGATFNPGGTHTTLDNISHYIHTHDLQYILLANPPPVSSLHQLQLKQQHNLSLIYTTPPDTNKTAQVAILYSLNFFNPHNPNDITEDPSGRLLSVILSSIAHNTRIHLIASYFPPNLDNTPLLTTQQLTNLRHKMTHNPNPIAHTHKNCIKKRQETERLRMTVTKWATDTNADHTILGGDHNETLHHTDRLPLPTTTTHRTNTLLNLLNDGWTDTYNTTPQSLSSNNDDPTELGHTYYHFNNTSSSRLDHIFIWHPSHSLPYNCYVNNTFDLNSSTTQHRPLHLHIELPSTATPQHPNPPWKPTSLYVPPNLTPATATQISNNVNTALLHQHPHLHSQFDSLLPTDPTAETKLDARTQTMSTALATLYKNATTTRNPQKPNTTHSLLPHLRQSLIARKHFLTLQFWTQRTLTLLNTQPSPPRNFYTPQNAAALTFLRHSPTFSYLTADIDNTSWQLSNNRQWQNWLNTTPSLLRRLNATIKEHTPSTHPSHKHYKHTMFATPSNRGKFYDFTFHKKHLQDTLKSVWTPTGHYITEPPLVKQEIHKQMAKQFSHRSTGPAVNAARPLNTRELHSGTPDWWRAGSLSYNRGAGNNHPEYLQPLSQPTNSPELRTLISSKMQRNTSPGLDGICTGVIKILTNTYFNDNSPPNATPTPTLQLLTAYTNATLRLGKLAQSQKEGLICMHPKPGKDPKLLNNRRPITLLPELGKLPFRLIAYRLTNILHHHPDLLDPAQRAYIKNGSTKQCLDLLMEITKHFNTHNQHNRNTMSNTDLQHHNLIVLFYDIAKAFDSVQRYSIEATLHRFNFPLPTISLILSALDNATSRVKTHHGPTAPFPLLTSVKQGDPLAALLFIFLMDNLHKGLRNNPLYPNTTAGYNSHTQDNPHNTTSIGYADDTTLINTSWAATQRQHMWVLDFLIAHRLQLNADKTTCIAANPLPSHHALPTTSPDIIHDPLNHKYIYAAPYPPLSTPKATPTPITLYPPTHTTRVLGLQYNIQENNTHMKRAIDAVLYSTCKHIKEANLNISHTSFVLSEYLYPKLEIGLTFYTYSPADLATWDRALQQLIFNNKNGPHMTNIPLAGRWATLGLNPLSTHYKHLQTTHYLTTLLSTSSPASQHHHKHLATTIANRHLRLIPHHLGNSNYSFSLICPTRTHPHHHHLNAHNIYLAYKPPEPSTQMVPLPPTTLPPHTPLPLPPPPQHIHLQHSPSAHHLHNTNHTTPMTAFPDGSCLKHQQNQCGYATILLPTSTLTQPNYDFAPHTYVVLDGGSPYTGLN